MPAFVRSLLALLCFLLVAPKTASSHPVTFEDGVAFSAMFQPGSVLVEGGYTLSRHFAIGSTYLRMMTKDGEIHGGAAHINSLVYRYNGDGSQANIYIIGGGGGGLFQNDTKTGLGYSALQLDFETMRFYTALMSRAVSDFEDVSYNVMYRFGFAPYLAPYNSLQSWLVAQSVYTPDMDETLNFMLFLRFFYKTVLWELGGDLKGRPWIHIMIHY